MTLHAAANLWPSPKKWSERGDSNPGPLPPQESATVISMIYGQFLERMGRVRFRSVQGNLWQSAA